MKLKQGDKIYYGGDMANEPWFGTITEVVETRFGTFVNVVTDNGDEKTYIPVAGFSEKYAGNGLTRFVLKSAYDEYMNELKNKY